MKKFKMANGPPQETFTLFKKKFFVFVLSVQRFFLYREKTAIDQAKKSPLPKCMIIWITILNLSTLSHDSLFKGQNREQTKTEREK